MLGSGLARRRIRSKAESTSGGGSPDIGALLAASWSFPGGSLETRSDRQKCRFCGVFRMGLILAKWDHIRAVGQTPAVAAAWRARHGRDFSEGDVDAIFQVFEPMNIAAVRDHADIIPGSIVAIAALRQRGMRIGATTGYTRDHGCVGTARRRVRLHT